MNKALERLRAFFDAPEKTLTLGVALGLAFTLLHVLFSYDAYNDVAGCYAPMAREIGRGDWSALLSWLPPLQPALSGLLCMAGLEPLQASIAVSGLFYVAAVWPLYLLLRNFLPERESAWGCLLYILAPKIIRFGCAGLLEPGRNFFVAALAALLLAEWKGRGSWLKSLLLGLTLGALAMSRSEGIAFAIPALLASAFFGVAWTPSWKAFAKTLLNLSVATAALCLALAPRTIQIYKETGYPSPDMRLLEFFHLRAPGEAHPRILERGVETPEAERAPETAKAGTEAPGYDASKPGSVLSKLGSAFGAALSTMRSNFGKTLLDCLRGSYELYLAFGAFGLLSLLASRSWRHEYWILLGLAAINFACFLTVVSAYRYFSVDTLLLMPFTVAGFAAAAKLLVKLKLAWLVPPVLAVLAVLQIGNGFENLRSKDGAEERRLALWLKDNVKPSGEDGRLKILVRRPQLCFWSESAHVTLDTQRPNEAARLSRANFDIAVFTKHERTLQEEFLKLRPDMKKLESHPGPKGYQVYVDSAANPAR